MSDSVSLLSTVHFSQMGQWDVKQFFLDIIRSSYAVEELGKHIVHETKKIQLSDWPEDEFVILGVSNKIGMFDASIEKGKRLRQKYHVVEDGWLAYNPYRINVGSIGVKTAELEGGYISPAYVVFSCKETLLPEFLWLLMKSGQFSAVINASTTGSVRQTLRFDKLAKIKVPIPTVEEQKIILAEYNSVLANAEKCMSDADRFSDGLLLEIQSMVSDLEMENLAPEVGSSIMQVVPFTATRRWEVGYIRKQGRLDEVCASFTCPSYSIDELQTESLFGLSVKASSTKQVDMIPVLRMTNIVNGEIDTTELKYLPGMCATTAKEPDKWLLKDGDFLVTRTNGSKDLVGKSAVFHEDGAYTYASYLIRYRFNALMVLPDYVNILFLTPLVREQIAVMRRQGGGQYNLNSEEIGSIKIPVPSIQEQREIIERYHLAKGATSVFYNDANQLRRRALADFEKNIFA